MEWGCLRTRRAFGHQQLGIPSEREHCIAHRAVARVGECPPIERASVTQALSQPGVMLDLDRAHVQSGDVSRVARFGFNPFDPVGGIHGAGVRPFTDGLHVRLGAARSYDCDRPVAPHVLPMQKQGRQAEKVVPMMVADDHTIELVGVNLETIECHQGVWWRFKQVAPIHDEPIPTKTAGGKGVSGTDELQCQFGHTRTVLRRYQWWSTIRGGMDCCRLTSHNLCMTYNVGIINVTGFAGMEAARLLWKHPEARLRAITGRSLAGQKLGEVFPHLALYGDMPITAEIESEVDIVFSALPTAASAEACAPFVRAGVKVIDIAADFRLRDAAAFEEWFGRPHPAPELLARAVYGLPELNREHIRSAQLVANPGCYPAASILALAPAVAAGIVSDQIVVDAKSGISGAGRGSGGGFGYSEVNEDVSAYKVANHNHQPEIAQELGALREAPKPKVTFVPHLVPMTRGIHSTCYAPLARTVSKAEVMAIYRDFYATAPFTRVVDAPPHTKHTLGSNMCLVHPTVDERNGMLVAIGVLDNLVKGAAGQAIENMNLMLGLPQECGLDLPAVYP